MSLKSGDSAIPVYFFEMQYRRASSMWPHSDVAFPEFYQLGKSD